MRHCFLFKFVLIFQLKFKVADRPLTYFPFGDKRIAILEQFAEFLLVEHPELSVGGLAKLCFQYESECLQTGKPIALFHFIHSCLAKVQTEVQSVASVSPSDAPP